MPVGESSIEASVTDLEAAARGGKVKTYNCKRDKVVDDPGSIEVTVLSGLQLRIQLTEGIDTAGMSVYYTYKLVDESGVTTSLSTWVRRCYDTYFISDGIVGGLEPGSNYSVSLMSRDACGNQAETAATTISMPSLTNETTAPVVNRGPYIKFLYIWGAAFNPKVTVAVEDDTGIDRVEFFIDGEPRGTDSDREIHLFQTSQGELYQSGYVSDLRDTGPHLFVANVYDVFGNVTMVSREISVTY